jgi:hypothetical protein
MSGASNLVVEARTALLDALVALTEHSDSVIVVGAQAVYLHTGSIRMALAETTKDSDLALDSRSLGAEPLIEVAMTRAGFILDPVKLQPGAWITPSEIPVDLMVPELIAGGSRRSVRIPPHSNTAARRTRGLEAALVDNVTMEIASLVVGDPRSAKARVAGPAALLVAKLHKMYDRFGDPRRTEDKDAHDIYRLLVAIPTDRLAHTWTTLCNDELSADVSRAALGYFGELFAAGPNATGSVMVGRAVYGVGDPEFVSTSVAALAQDLTAAPGHI